MNFSLLRNTSSRMRPAGYAMMFLAGAGLLLIAFGFYTGEPVFFLKWFFGLQADD